MLWDCILRIFPQNFTGNLRQKIYKVIRINFHRGQGTVKRAAGLCDESSFGGIDKRSAAAYIIINVI